MARREPWGEEREAEVAPSVMRHGAEELNAAPPPPFFDSLDSPSYTWWFETWWGWGLVVGVGLLMLLVGRTFRISAGADWFMDRKTLIKTYELVQVAVEKDMSEGELHLRDQRGQQVSVGLASLQSNETLWDLVYNGIRHSVVNGAQVNRMAVERLHLWDEVTLREQRWYDQRAE